MRVLRYDTCSEVILGEKRKSVISSIDSIDLYIEKLHPDIIAKERYTVMRNTSEYDNQICDMNATPQSHTFWNLDIHFGTRLDQPTFFGELDHRVILALGQQGGGVP